MPDKDVFQQEFESGNTSEVREFVSNAAVSLGGTADDVFACELAADEAASNVFRHAYHGQGGKLKVLVWREENAIIISLRDWGQAFDPATVPEPNTKLPLEERPVGGLGLFLIRQLMQDVSFSFHPQAGNVLVLRRKLT